MDLLYNKLRAVYFTVGSVHVSNLFPAVILYLSADSELVIVASHIKTCCIKLLMRSLCSITVVVFVVAIIIAAVFVV